MDGESVFQQTLQGWTNDFLLFGTSTFGVLIVILWNIKKISHALGCEPLQSSANFAANGFSIDSRNLQPGQVFVCMAGEKGDGHQYIQKALQAGASGLLIEDSYIKKSTRLPPETTVFRYESGLAALQKLAKYHRGQLSSTVIGITGSNGKTSSKDILSQLLSILVGKDQICSTLGNYNNHLGLPLSLLQATTNTRYLILEMGMNHSGEIGLLSQIARPHHALITGIGTAHHEFFTNTEEIAEAKLEILQGMLAPKSKKSHLVYHAYSVGAQLAIKLAKNKGIQPHFFCISSLAPQNALASELSLPDLNIATELELSLAGTQFLWRNQRVDCPNLFHSYLASNLLGCLCLLSALGFAQKELVEACSKLRLQTKRRFEIILKSCPDQHTQLLVDDSYNASPDSFLAAISSLRWLKPKGELALFMGEMGELGKIAQENHRKVAQAAAKNGFTLLGLQEGQFSQTIKKAFLAEKPDGKVMQAKNATKLSELLEKSEELSRFAGILVKGHALRKWT